MRSRQECLRDLVRLAAPLDRLRGELAQHPWDSPVPFVTLCAGDVVRVLDRFLKGELTASAVEEWADALEMREDVTFEKELVKEAIFDLANPVLQGALTLEVASRWLDRLAR